MKIKIIGTGSNGNCYVLQDSNGNNLIIDCGVYYFDKNINGVLISHSHKDHCKFVKNYINLGINVYMSKETKKELKLKDEYNIIEISHENKIKIGEYNIIPFEVTHDVYNLSFLIKHNECGIIYYATDMCSLDYLFSNVNTYLIEANYNNELLMSNEKLVQSLKDRIINSHFSDKSLKQYFENIDKNNLKNIILIHKSTENFDEKIVDELKSIFGVPVYTANNGDEYFINIY